MAMGCYAAVLHALNYMDKDLLLVAKDDELGRKLQDLNFACKKARTQEGINISKANFYLSIEVVPYYEISTEQAKEKCHRYTFKRTRAFIR